MRIRAVVFDLFDTLTVPYDDKLWDGTVAAMADLLGISRTDFARAWDVQWADLLGGALSISGAIRRACGSCGTECSMAAVDGAARHWERRSRVAMEPAAEALSVLMRLRDAGLRIGLISDCTPDVPDLWRDSPLAPFVERTVFSAAVKVVKPAPALFHAASASLGVSTTDCLYVADGSGRELTGAALVGMTPVLLRSVDPLPDRMAAYRPDARAWTGLVVRSLAALPRLVRAI